jgi:hypothetical protein
MASCPLPGSRTASWPWKACSWPSVVIRRSVQRRRSINLLGEISKTNHIHIQLKKKTCEYWIICRKYWSEIIPLYSQISTSSIRVSIMISFPL